MRLIKDIITVAELSTQHLTRFRTMVKAVVDVERGLMAIDAELHADLEAWLLEQGSRQEDLWGINLYPGKKGEDLIEYTALINIRPGQGNPGMEVQDLVLRTRIADLVKKLVLHEP